jgi:hypothetical protein
MDLMASAALMTLAACVTFRLPTSRLWLPAGFLTVVGQHVSFDALGEFLYPET